MLGYIEAPDLYPGGGYRSVFLAGGITGCPDWQTDAVNLLDDRQSVGDLWTAFNPRQADFDINNPKAATNQVAWEHYHLRLADVILFWFAAEEIQPIALYELGAWCMTDKPLAVGVHPSYPRRADVYLQTNLVRPQIAIHQSLETTVGDAAELLSTHKSIPPA